MEKRRYRNTDTEISLLGYGCMRLPRIDPEKQEIDTEAAQELIDYAYAHGVNYFDTAYMYHAGQSEVFIGQALKKYPRESYYLANKMPVWFADTEEDVERIFLQQLERCDVEYFDFYLCHSLNREHWKRLEEFGVYDYLAAQKKAGKIRRLGFSFHDTPDLLEEILQTHEWDFAQIQLNYLDWEMQDAERQYELLEQYGLQCIVMEPVRGGALATLSEDAAALLKEAEPNRSVASWAIRYVASLPNVLTVLSGMSTAEQLRDNIQTMEQFVPLTADDKALVYRAKEMYLESRTVPCTGCRYCMDCPAGVDIPLMFGIFNAFKMKEDKAAANRAFASAGKAKQAANCVSCRKCTRHCPQLIDIPERLREVADLQKQVEG